jgi:DNA-binding NarL/FixJ family response regulator
VRVALADDSALFRGGLAALLRAAEVEVSAQAASGPLGAPWRVVSRAPAATGGTCFQPAPRAVSTG